MITNFDFANYSFEDANEVFGLLKTRIDETQSNRDFIKGDDWQDGEGWVGPQFEGSTDVSRNLRQEIKREFASKGSIRGVVRRKVRGVIGRVPNWLISSRNAPDNNSQVSSDIEERIGEAQIILNEFWKHSKAHRILKRWVTDYEVSGYSTIRLLFSQKNTEVDIAQTFQDAVKQLQLINEEIGQAVIVFDKETLDRASFVRYETDGKVFIEMCYINVDGFTVFKKFSQNDGKEFAKKAGLNELAKNIKDQQNTSSELELPLNEKLLVFALDGEAMVSNSMRSQQRIVNKASTMLSHNLDQDGYRAKKIINALPPGEYQTNAEGQRVFVPNPSGIRVGAGSVEYINGLPVITKEGGNDTHKITTTYTTPGIFESQPIDVKSFIDSGTDAAEAILEEADQKHVSVSGDANASGESLKQQRHSYIASLEETKSLFDDEASDIFETVLASVAYLMGDEERYADLQVTVSAILNPGPVSSEDRRAAQDEFKNGIRTLESTMEETGITDPDAMKAKIAQEPESELNRISQVLDVINKAPASLSLLERRRLLYPHKTEAEHLADIAQLAKEDPTIAAAYGITV